MTKNIETEFFKDKRPWSKIKDKVIRNYLSVYLRKVRGLNKGIVLVDAFAGPGRFDDGSIGSPIIISQLAEKYVPGKFIAIFVNNNPQHDAQLRACLKKSIERQTVIPILGDAKDLLAKVAEIVTDHTLFIYVDPFGLRGCEFATIKPFLTRDKAYSTEIVINISIPIMFRLAARNAVNDGKANSKRIMSFHNTLTATLGGDYWKKYLLDNSLVHHEQIGGVMSDYRSLIQKYMPVAGYCPVSGSGSNNKLKYYITFASRHPDAALLMNDFMFEAYWEYYLDSTFGGTLFENMGWESLFAHKYFDSLKSVIRSQLVQNARLARKFLWRRIVHEEFMRFSSKHFRKAVSELVVEDVIRFEDISGTNRLNDDSILSLKEVN